MPGGPKFRNRVPEMVNGTATKVSSYSNPETGLYKEGEEFYFDSYFAKRALDGLKTRNREKPLLLNAMFLAPHPPLHIPEPWYNFVKNENFELPDNVGVYYPKQSPLQMYNLTGVIGARYSRNDWRESWRVYLGLVSMLDSYVGQLLDEVKNREFMMKVLFFLQVTMVKCSVHMACFRKCACMRRLRKFPSF